MPSSSSAQFDVYGAQYEVLKVLLFARSEAQLSLMQSGAARCARDERDQREREQPGRQ